MLVVKGVNVFPSQIESVLLEVEGVEPHSVSYTHLTLPTKA